MASTEAIGQTAINIPGTSVEKTTIAASGKTVWLMAATAGIVVANNYYSQPLLDEMATGFDIADEAASWISSLTQIGYALGLLFLLPLGDRMDRRKLISIMLVLATLMLVGFSLAPSYEFTLVFGFLIGLTSIVPQILPPAASQMFSADEAPVAVGRIMAGLLLGIVLSRFVGGWFGGFFGWRAVYLAAAVAMLVLLVTLRRSLPPLQPTFSGSYSGLMRSLVQIYRTHPTLRSLAFAAALQFGAFSLFWTTLAFHLATMPGHYPPSVAGTFALIGAGGVIGAAFVSKLSKSFSVRLTLVVSGVLMLLSFPIFALATSSLFWMVPAVVLIDLGMQMSHVTSMSTILSLDRGASSRLNTLYMFIRFAGGAVGTLVGGLAWAHGGWFWVCVAGFGFCFVALAINGLTSVASQTPAR